MHRGHELSHEIADSLPYVLMKSSLSKNPQLLTMATQHGLLTICGSSTGLLGEAQGHKWYFLPLLPLHCPLCSGGNCPGRPAFGCSSQESSARARIGKLFAVVVPLRSPSFTLLFPVFCFFPLHSNLPPPSACFSWMTFCARVFYLCFSLQYYSGEIKPQLFKQREPYSCAFAEPRTCVKHQDCLGSWPANPPILCQAQCMHD